MNRVRVAVAVAGILGSGWLASDIASAQSLDAAVERMLNNNCVQLGTPAAQPPGSLGPNLDAICQDSASANPTPSSSGGGGVSAQGSETLLSRQRAESRLEEERGASEAAASDVATVTDLFDVAGLGLWLSADYTDRDRDVTTFEDGYESDVWGGSAGVDYRFSDAFFAGLAFDYENIDGDLDGGGDFETDSYGGVLYASFAPAPQVFIDGSIGYAWKDYDMERFLSFSEANQNTGGIELLRQGFAESDTDGGEWSGRGIVGYDFVTGALTIGPRAGVSFAHTEIDGYRESGNTGIELVFSDRTRQSLQSVAGVSSSAAVPTGFGVVVPQVDLEWVHEFQDDQRHHSVRFVEDLRTPPAVFSYQNQDPDRDFFNLDVGTSVILPGGFQAFVLFKTLLGHSHYDSYGATLGVRMELGGS